MDCAQFLSFRDRELAHDSAKCARMRPFGDAKADRRAEAGRSDFRKTVDFSQRDMKDSGE